MIKEGKFGVQEAVSIVVISIVAKLFFTSPAVLADIIGSTGWLSTLISAAVAAVEFTFIYLLLKRFPGKNIVEIFDIALGRFFGFIFSGLLVLFFLYDAASVVRESAEVLKAYILPLTPPSIVIGFFLIGAVIFSFLGLESIARVSKLSAYFVFSILIIVLILASQNYDFRRLFPIFGFGLDKTLVQGALRSSAYGEVIILAVIAGSLQGVKHIKKAGYLSLGLSAVLGHLIFLAFSMTFPYYAAREILSPMYEMTTLIDYGTFVQRLDPIFLFIWTAAALIIQTIYFYIAASIYCKMFRIQDIRPVILPFAIIIFCSALIPKDSTSVVIGYVQTIRQFTWPIIFIPPIIALIAAILRKKKGGTKNA